MKFKVATGWASLRPILVWCVGLPSRVVVPLCYPKFDDQNKATPTTQVLPDYTDGYHQGSIMYTIIYFLYICLYVLMPSFVHLFVCINAFVDIIYI